MKKLKLLIATIFAFAFSFAPAALVAGSAYAATTQSQDSLCAGASLDASKIGSTTACSSSNANAATNVTNIVKLTINIFSWIIGVVAVFAIIFGGFKYITSGGDSSGVTSAKNTILYAVIGLIVALLAYAIINFVIDSVLGDTGSSSTIRNSSAGN